MSHDTMVRILCLVCMSMNAPVVGICLEKMLHVNNQTSSRLGRIMYWCVTYVLVGSFRIFLPLNTNITPIHALYFIVTFFMMRRCYTDKINVKYGAFIMMEMLLTVADIMYGLCYYIMHQRGVFVGYSQLTTAMDCMAVTLLGSLLQVLAAFFWCRKNKFLFLKSTSVLMIVILTVLILLEMLVADVNILNDSVFGGEVYLVVYNCLFVTLCLFVFLMIVQNEKKEIRQELTEVQRLLELQQTHYKDTEARREEMAKIRHDYNNIIAAVLHLLESGDVQQAEKVLTDSIARIAATKEYSFCGIPIVNAILTEKKAECDAGGIELAVDLLLPDQLPVKDLDLCIGLGNLMDNAIHACENQEGAVPKIQLSAGVIQGYLVIKCVNPMGGSRKTEGSGYGLKILKDLSERYQGDFYTEQKEGCFTAQLSLSINQA